MKRIRQLPPDVVTKIAAGEVIERPGSVVKELLENSIDAGSTRIDIDLDAGGTDLIRVVDDGHGIVAEDLGLAFSSHATSKLQNANDLFAINTMGFRGEALASIGGIAKVTLQSRTHDQESGSELRCDGGELSPLRPWNGAPGTRIEVRHLFFNVPVRKKFLKSVATELGHVCETVTRLALANPTLHITLRHNGKLVYEIPASAGLLDRIALFFSGEVRDALYDVDSGPGIVRVTGFIADPKCDRGNAKLQYLFVNGRWFRDRSVAHAMQEAFRGLLMSGRYSVGFLFLSVPPDKVDVNVHPTKAEVRFQENSLIYSLVRSAVKHRLLKENLVPRLAMPLGEEPGASGQGTWDRRQEPERPALFSGQFQRPDPSPWYPTPLAPVSPPGQVSPRREEAEQTVAPWELPDRGTMMTESHRPGGVNSPSETALQPNPSSNLASNETHSRQEASESIPPPGRETSSPVNTAGGQESVAVSPSMPFPLELSAAFGAGRTAIQIQDSYLVLETSEGMLVIDQHALHERILFEQLRRRVRDGKLEVQRLLIPEPIDLPAEQAALVLEAADALKELGLEVSDFGGNTILLSSYPTLLGRKSPHEIFQGVVDYLLNKERPPTRDAMLHLLMATMACKAAVKAGDRLTPEEIAHLLHLRQLAEDSHHCPHGRPTSLLFSRQELDKQFRRT
ncbi:MAG TPA: DNA mismatch repair endonuclease MutL [Gemmata sp.]|jgi:DNA mismatch repair protein MutL|nr:DNA mismatch repair endonuclease MutL [Gemmata sp.]